MNAQNSGTRTTVKRSFEMPSRPQRAAWVKKNKRRLRLLRAVMVGLCAVTALLGLVLLILPMFRIGSIEVKGNTVTSYEEIVEASGISIGDEIVGYDFQTAIKNVQKSCPVEVKLIRPGLNKVVIEVAEKEAMYTAYAGSFFSLDQDMNVLDMSDNEAEFSSLVKVELPPIQYLSVGSPVVFQNPNADLSYITELLEGLRSMELTEQLDVVDVSEKFNVSYVMNGNVRVVLGKVSELAEKQAMAQEILLSKAGSAACAVIDVSNVKCSTYRPVSAVELMA